MGQIYTIPKFMKKEIEKTITKFPLEQKNITSQAANSTLYLEVWARYYRHRYSIKLS